MEEAGAEVLDSGDIPLPGHILAGVGAAFPGAGRIVNLGLRLMPHMECRKDIGIDIHTMGILTDNKRQRRILCITDITHMENGLLPGVLQGRWAIL
ncbi:MAG: hypothetical protein JRF35_10915 [Deltaproteobacteria bacterium]|nr:hypothetical protein [Deltaproteobacteria bacterium]